MSRSRLAIAATALVLVLGACSDSKSSGSAKLADGTSESSSSDSDSSADDSSSGGSSSSAKGVCADITELSPSLGSADSFTKKNIVDLLTVLAGIKKVADSDTKKQIDIASKYFVQLDDILSKFDYDIAAASDDAEAVAALTELSSSEEMTAAGEAIDTWTQDNCGLTLGGQ